MKICAKYLIVILIMIFSFYYTNKAALLAKNSNPIMKSINEYKDEVKVSSVDATIMDDYIIPGVNGLEVNVNKSFNKMKPYHIFNKTYLIYNQIKPKISLEDNKDKIIINGNKSKKEVSLVIQSETQEKLLDEKQIKYDILTKLSDYNSKKERINNESKKYKELDKIFDANKVNKGICIVNSEVNINYCKDNNYYLVQAKKITRSNYINMKEIIGNGSILLIAKDLKNEELELIIKYIQSKDLKFVYLSELISEKNQ